MKVKLKIEPFHGVPLRRVREELRKVYGANLVTLASEAPGLDVPRLPTNVFPVDLCLAGGFPIGRVALLAGAKASGKTTLALRAVAQWQQMTADRPEAKAAWLDVEGVYEPRWARAAGVDESRLHLSRTDYAEQAVDIFCALLATEEIELMVLDSVAFLTPSAEIENSALKWQQGLQARLTGKLVRRMVSLLNGWRREGQPRTVILLNQLRSQITGFGTTVPQIEPGGVAQQFAASVVLRTRRKEYVFLDEKDKLDGAKGAAKAVNHLRVITSKVSPPGVECEFTIALRPHEGLKPTDPDDGKAFLLRAFSTKWLRKEEGRWRAGSLAEGRTQEEALTALLTDLSLLARGKAEVIALACAQAQAEG